MKHAHIVPLAGGSVIGTSQALKSKPEYLASWSIFGKNDQWCRQYYPEVPFINLDDQSLPSSKIDLVTCVPPCSGLSNATTGTRGCFAPQNQHMLNVAELAMQKKAQVVIIENAPTLYSAGGYPFFVNFVPIAKKHGYSIQLFKTSTILHGLPQNRVRTFVLLWKGNSLPILDFISHPYKPLTQFPISGKGERVYPGKGSDDELVSLIYKTIGGRKAMYDLIDGPVTAFNVALKLGLINYKFETERYAKLFNRAKYKAVLDVTPTFVKNYTNALMWKVTTYMLHPTQDRFISIRELMNMMGLPKDYPEIPRQFMNHIFQNVPVNTVKTLVDEVTAALDGKRKFKKVPFMKVNNIKQEIDSVGYTLDSLLYE